MNYLRNLVLAAVTTLSVVLPLTGPTAAQANPHQGHHHHHHRIYWVYYRSSPDTAWVCYGGYYQLSQAEQAVTYFRYYGYDSFYR